MNSNKEYEKTRKMPNSQKIVSVLLVVFSILLFAGIWFREHPVTNNPISLSDVISFVDSNDQDGNVPLAFELTDPSSITVLVNKYHSLPSDYVPSDLTEPYVNSTEDVIRVSNKAADHLKQMVNAANEAGIQLYLTAGYISYETQEDYYADRVSLVGESEASRTIPKAGYSEHQTGLAFDFSNESTGKGMTVSFAQTDAGKWLFEHAHEYGFILRYPDGKENITGYAYTPWHYRYVGTDVSKAMYEISPDLTMEEYYSVSD